jgi:tetratricopeptide (TPR) repeat protein
LQQADFETAITQFQTALKSTPDDPTLHYNLGLALKLKDQLPEALAELRKAEELDPSQPDVHYTLGVTLWQQGSFDESVKELRAAIASRSDYAEAFYTLGTVLKQQGKMQEAAQALREAIRLQPDFAGAHTTLASVLRTLGDQEGAAAEARAGAQIGQQTTGLQAATLATSSGRRLLGAGDVDGAIAQFRSAINSSPDYAQAHFQLAIALRRKGEKDESAKEFRRAAELDPQLSPPAL